MMCQLMKLSDPDISLLIKSLEKENLDDSIHALCFLKQITEWKKKVPELNIAVYSPEGDFTDNTFIFTLIIEGGVFCSYYSMSDTGSRRLKESLCKTNIFSADCYCILTSIPARVHDIVGTEWRRRLAGPEQHVQNCHNYFLSKQDAEKLSVECPDDVFIRDLTLDDAELVNSEWPHRNHISPYLIKGIISTSTCLGVCCKQTGELLSWALKWYYGGIGVVQTLPHAKRRGYAQAVVTALVKRMAAESWPIHLVIIDGNPESTPLFTKMGFVKINPCYWFYYHVFDQDHS